MAADAATESFTLSEEVKQEIDKWLAKYPPEQKRSALVPALLFVQKQNKGWLSDSAMQALADYLGLPRIEVYEAATFYDMYELQPVGRHLIRLCTNVSCLLRGSDQLVAACQKAFGIGLGETSADGKVTLREAECMGACGGAPMCQVDDKEYHENLTAEKLVEIVNALE